MGFLKNFSLRYKIILPGVIGVIGFALYLIINYSVSIANAQMLAAVRESYFAILGRANQNVDDLVHIKQNLAFAVSTGEQSMVDAAEGIGREIQKNTQDLAKLDSKNTGRVNAISTALSDYLGAAIPLTKAMVDGSADMSQARKTIKMMNERLKELEGLLPKYREQSLDDFMGAIQEVNDRNKQALLIGVLMGVITMVILLGVAWWVSGMVTSDVKNVVNSLKEIASGDADLTQQIQSKSQDEIGDLVKWFNTFIRHLRGIVGEVVNSTAQLSTSAEEMASIVAQTRDGAEYQQRETVQLASAIHEMTMTIEGMAQNASQVAEITKLADEESAGGKEVVADTIATIEALVDEVKNTAAAIQKLEQESNNVGRVLDVIRDIADQTNLLALNAAIEAARAGEQGRGFAVVADEVRVLAQRSSQSTNDIRDIIERLQDEAHGAVNVMKSGMSKAQNSAERASSARTALESITERVSRIATMNSEIAVTAEEQSKVVGEVNKSISTISGIAQDSAEGAEQNTSASGELAKLAIHLQGLVGKFKL